MQSPREWIVGLDLTPRSPGPSRWATWLSERSSRPPNLVALSAGELTDFNAEHSATTAGGERGVRGLIVGRNRPTDSWALVSLGHVARRVLRRVDDPVFVVPPDHEPPTHPGPILVGVTPNDHALPAVRMATALGKELDLRVEYVHVLPTGSFFMRVADYDAGRPRGLGWTDRDAQWGAKAALRRWSARHGLEFECRFEVGRPAEALVDAARRLHATMVVTGSRQLSTVARLFEPSVGNEVAGKAQVPTLVVPPRAFEQAQAS